jgi:hypothetical protein
MAEAAKAALGAAALSVVADTGYYNGETLKACEDDAITAYVPPPDRDQRLKAQGRFSIEDFGYDAAPDHYRCPAGAELRPMRGHKRQGSGKAGGSLCQPPIGLPDLPAAGAMPGSQRSAARDRALGARGCGRAPPGAHAHRWR